VWLIKAGFLDWTLDLLDTPLTILMITIHRGAIANSQLESMLLSLFHTVCLQFTTTRTELSGFSVPH
jgi:hypothetical protein